MKLSIQREALLKPLQLVTGVVERKHTLPILANILLQVDKGQVTFVGTDLEIEAKVTIAHAQKGSQEGKTTLPARKLLDIVRTLPEQAMIDLVEDKGKVTLRAGKSRYTLATLPAEEFPLVGAVQATGELQLSQKELKELIESTQFAMAQQDVRYYLNGLLLEIADGKLNAVATDGHRLAMCSVGLPDGKAEPRQVIVPRKAVQELARLLEDSNQPVVVTLSANHIQFVTDGVSLTTKQIDGRFPDYQRVLPKGGDKVVIAEREGLRQSLVRISVISSEKFRSVALQLKPGQINLHTHNPEQEEADEEVAVEYSGAELQIGFNVTYLQDAISATKGQRVQITFSDANSSCLVHAEGDERSKYVVMPMRL